MQDFRQLQVWQKSHELTLAGYRSTQSFPREELYGLTSQVRRSAVSIPANIAEGCCRSGDIEFGRFLQIAMGSASELECCLLLARDLELLNGAEYERLVDAATEVKRMLASLIQRLKADH
jgi:four helix bundle protein